MSSSPAAASSSTTSIISSTSLSSLASVVSASTTGGVTATPAATSTSTTTTSGGGGGGGSGGGGLNNSDNPGSFYKNLFYILIGLLVAFGLVSIISLTRARRRRRAIIREAERLGVLVPGVPGYIPIRERRAMTWAKSDGTDMPDWWEVEGKEKGQGMDDPERIQRYTGSDPFLPGETSFQPLAIVPPSEPITVDPIQTSHLPYFPNHLAYRESSLRPPPSRYRSSDPSTLNDLYGETIDLVTIVRMPFDGPQPSRGTRGDGDRATRHGDAGDDEEDPEGVVREWGGIELGIEKIEVDRR